MKTTSAPFKLFTLAWPIFLSQLIQTLIYTIDTLMLGRYSDLAVAAVGTVAQIITTANLIFGFITIGAGIIMSQLLGSGRPLEAGRIARIALLANLCLGFIVSGGLFFGAGPILQAISMPPELMDYGKAFLTITGSASVAAAFVMTAEMMLRMNGMVKRMMALSLTVVIINTIGNYLVLFSPLGLPSFGVTGVAWATFVSRFAGTALALIMLVRSLRHYLFTRIQDRLRWAELREILRLGVPSAGEHLSYSASQVVITAIVTLLGTAAITTKIYTQSITGYVFLISTSIGQATTIMIGYSLGAGLRTQAKQTGNRHLQIGLSISLLVSFMLYLFSGPIIGWFTADREIIETARNLLLLSVVLEAARACNVIMIAGLNASGDVRFPVMIGLILMWGVSVPLAYLLGIVLEMGIYGIWLAFIIDEWIRAACMIVRWRSGKWQEVRLSAVTTEVQKL